MESYGNIILTKEEGIKMKKYLITFKSWEDENKTLRKVVNEYFDFQGCLECKTDNGFYFISKERIISVEKIEG